MQLTVGYIEETLYKDKKTSFGINFVNYVITNWKRFLDACFIQWTKSFQDSEIIIIIIILIIIIKTRFILNNLHKYFKFTLQYSHTRQPLLDALV